MKLPEHHQSWLRRPPLWLGVSVLVFFLGLSRYRRYLLDELSILNDLVRAGIEINWQTQTIIPKPWFSALLLSLIVAVVLLVVFLVRARFVSSRPRSDLEMELAKLNERYEVATMTLRETMDAASRVREQLFPISEVPAKNIRSRESTYIIRSNFDVEAKHIYEVEAADRPLHFMEIFSDVEEGADGADYLYDIKFKVNDGNGKPLAYIPSLNEPRHKRVMVYFLPQVVPGEARPRKVVLTYSWPGMFKQLAFVGSEPFEWALHSKENIPEIGFQFYLEPGTGRQLDCEVCGSLEGEQALRDTLKHPIHQWPGWEYRIRNAPPGKYRLRVLLRKA
jgi:hypothetical protein